MINNSKIIDLLMSGKSPLKTSNVCDKCDMVFTKNGHDGTTQYMLKKIMR